MLSFESVVMYFWYLHGNPEWVEACQWTAVSPENTYGDTQIFVLQTSSVKSNHTEVMCTGSESLENQALDTVSQNYLALQNTIYWHLFEMAWWPQRRGTWSSKLSEPPAAHWQAGNPCWTIGVLRRWQPTTGMSWKALPLHSGAMLCFKSCASVLYWLLTAKRFNAFQLS